LQDRLPHVGSRQARAPGRASGTTHQIVEVLHGGRCDRFQDDDVTRHDPADTRSPTLAAVSEKGVVLGTVAYMSPEQARGEAVDFRSDQFSLGTVIYEMLTGKRPFGGASAAETLAAIIRDEPEPLEKSAPNVPSPVRWVVQQCLSKDPEERYSSTKDLAKELQKLRTHLSEAVSAADVAPGKTPRLRRRVLFWALAAVAALAVAVGLLLGGRFLRTGSPPAPPLSLTLSFPPDAAPDSANTNPLALSPDGRRVATISYGKAEEMSLLFGDFARGTLTQSPAEGSFDLLAWTPDGSRIAFGYSPQETGTMGVFWQRTDGSSLPESLLSETPQKIVQADSFSPDGSVLLVEAYDYTHASPADTRWGIFAVPLTGERKLHPLLETKFSVELSRFSPDGRWVAYRVNQSGRFQVYVQPYPGPSPRWQISTDGGDEPRWSRNGRELFFRNGDKMMAVDVQTKPNFQAGRPRTLFEGQYFSSGDDYDVAPDGRFLMIKPDPAESGPAHVKVVLNWFEEVNGRVPGRGR
jgi:hypothetical protein